MRSDIAEYLSALLLVYTICIFGWIIISLVFSFGMRVPYNRWSNAVLDFLRDVTVPFLQLFRRLPLRVGPLDLTPMVAIIVLQIGGGIVIGAIDPGP
jgi:YggT family protein